MGLNEHEQRVLDELERGLYADDEHLARRMQKTAAKAPDRVKQSTAARRIAGALVAVAGLGVVLVGAITHFAWIGASGFVIMLVGLAIVTAGPAKSSSVDKNSAAPKSPKQPKSAKPKSSGTPLERLDEFFEDRWRRRTE